ncbi:hypothetical protein RB213_013999 [Colletotrichum asianum]
MHQPPPVICLFLPLRPGWLPKNIWSNAVSIIEFRRRYPEVSRFISRITCAEPVARSEKRLPCPHRSLVCLLQCFASHLTL